MKGTQYHGKCRGKARDPPPSHSSSPLEPLVAQALEDGKSDNLNDSQGLVVQGIGLQDTMGWNQSPCQKILDFHLLARLSALTGVLQARGRTSCAYLSTSQPELGESDEVSEEDTSNGSHGPAAIGQLSLSEPLEGLGVGSQREGIKPAVTTGAGGKAWTSRSTWFIGGDLKRTRSLVDELLQL